jgi:hypothetical protein
MGASDRNIDLFSSATRGAGSGLAPENGDSPRLNESKFREIDDLPDRRWPAADERSNSEQPGRIEMGR